MDIKKYGQNVSNYIDKLTDKKFDELLIECGIETCPYKSDTDYKYIKDEK